MISSTNSLDPFANIEAHSKPLRPFLPKKAAYSQAKNAILLTASAKHLKIRQEFLGKYLVNRCINCSEVLCFDAHIHQDTRRVPLLSEKGWNYKPVICLSGRKCQYGHGCKFSHNQTEVLYHPLVFKTLVCEGLIDDHGYCNWGGQFCPKAHSLPNQTEGTPKDLHRLEDYGLRPVHLELTVEAQTLANRRAATDSATYKASVLRVSASKAGSQAKETKQQPRSQPDQINKVCSIASKPAQKDIATKANDLCMHCKQSSFVFILQCKHALCSACLDVESCPVCNP